MTGLKRSFRELLHYPSAIVSLVILSLLIAVSVYTLISIPYREAVRLWRGGEDVWYKLPQTVPPAWTNLFRRYKLPDTIILSSREGTAAKTVEPTASGSEINIEFTFDFSYDSFPQEVILYFASSYREKSPFAEVTWQTPDGREIRVVSLGVQAKQTYRATQDTKLQRRLGGLFAQEGLFAVPDSAPLKPLKGTYKMLVSGIAFEPDSDLDVELVIHGRVYGLAGTDHLRRDLKISLLWGIPVALAFGLLAALGTALTTMVIAATGTWFGGWVDELIQRITEVNMVLPFLPILLMVGTFYSRSIFVILAVTIALSIFGGAIKNYRAIFLQTKESPYIEAARAYGAGGGRIIIRYLVPRIVPMLIPQLVTSIPAYVFLEAGLAVLGLGDPTLPTWGKMIQNAQDNGALYNGLYYWVMEPAALLMLTGLAFAMLGFALDRIFNPRLREM